MDSRLDDIMNNALEAMEVLNQLDGALDELDAQKERLPLQTIQSMAERWGMSRQAVAMRAQRDPRFPKPLRGIIEPTKGCPRVFSLKDVKRYEREKGLLK